VKNLFKPLKTGLLISLLLSQTAKAEDAKAKTDNKTVNTPAQTEEETYANPESVTWDKSSQSWFVSNVAGNAQDKDGKGWITKINAEGKVTFKQWVRGLNAPKGIKTLQGKLYVADINELVIIDIATAQIDKRVAVDGAMMLNDIAVEDNKTVYISDTFANKIFSFVPGKDEKPNLLVQSEQLQGPNGLYIADGKIYIAAFGKVTDQKTWKTDKPGTILTYTFKTKKIEPIAKNAPTGNFDGIESLGGSFLVTDFVAGKLFQIGLSGESNLIQDGFKNCADIGFDPELKRLAIPEMGANKVSLIDLVKK